MRVISQRNTHWFSHIYDNYVLHAKTLPSKELLSCIFCVKNNTYSNWPHARTHFPRLFPEFNFSVDFPWPFLKKFPGFSRFSRFSTWVAIQELFSNHQTASSSAMRKDWRLYSSENESTGWMVHSLPLTAFVEMRSDNVQWISAWNIATSVRYHCHLSLLFCENFHQNKQLSGKNLRFFMFLLHKENCWLID